MHQCIAETHRRSNAKESTPSLPLVNDRDDQTDRQHHHIHHAAAMIDREFLTHAAAGTCGGVAGVYVGAPLDTIKVLLQTGKYTGTSVPVPVSRRSRTQPGHAPSTPGPPGVLECVRVTVRSQGALALYKGALTSALGQIPNNAVVFGSYGSTLAWLARTFPGDAGGAVDRGGGGGGYWHVFFAGCWAGFLQSLALAPFEHIKVRFGIECVLKDLKKSWPGGLVGGDGKGKVFRMAMSAPPPPAPPLSAPPTIPITQCQQQMTDWRPGVKHMSMVECGRGLVAAKGVTGGLYRGFCSLVWRDAPTYGLYFVVYEVLKARLTPPGTDDAPVLAMLVAGGLAGMASWAAGTPADVVKSVIQGSPITTPAAQNRIGAVAARLFKAEVRFPSLIDGSVDG